jgi:hypothetical protein
VCKLRSSQKSAAWQPAHLAHLKDTKPIFFINCLLPTYKHQKPCNTCSAIKTVLNNTSCLLSKYYNN